MRWKEPAVFMGNIRWPLVEKHEETGLYGGHKYNIKMDRLWNTAVWLRAQPSG